MGGGKKALTKDELVAQSRKERMEREVIRKWSDAANMV